MHVLCIAGKNVCAQAAPPTTPPQPPPTPTTPTPQCGFLQTALHACTIGTMSDAWGGSTRQPTHTHKTKGVTCDPKINCRVPLVIILISQRNASNYKIVLKLCLDKTVVSERTKNVLIEKCFQNNRTLPYRLVSTCPKSVFPFSSKF